MKAEQSIIICACWYFPLTLQYLSFHKSFAHPGLYLSVMPPPQIVFHFQLSKVVGVDIFYFIFRKGIFNLISSTVLCSVLLLPGKEHSWLLDVPSHFLQWHSCHEINIPQWRDPSSFSSRVSLVDTSQLCFGSHLVKRLDTEALTWLLSLHSMLLYSCINCNA